MVLKRFYDEKLAQASYLIGCPGAGEAAVIDPNRDIQQYIDAAKAEGMQITAVSETHIHADYLSGARELAKRTGAKLYLSDEGDENWKYQFAKEDGAILVRDGDSFRVGAVRFDIVHTPGHTPEHISFIITDEASGTQPLAALTGDFVFVGDVGRPDLLERAANYKGTMEQGAKVLHSSIQTFRNNYPDFLMLFPGHGSGSACGKSLGGVPVSTLGYEKSVNWALRDISESNFVNEVLSGQPEPPRYFAEMKKRNKQGPPILGDNRWVSEGENPSELSSQLSSGGIVLDIRPREMHAKEHFIGTIHIELGKSFTNWAGWMIPYDTPISIIALDAVTANEAARDLRMIGLDDVRHWYPVESARRSGLQQTTIPVISPREALEANGPLLDVRSYREYEEGHAPNAQHIPLGELLARISEVPKSQVMVYCGSGYRSSIATSILKNQGYDVVDVAGGFNAYKEAGLPIETQTPVTV